MDPNLFSSNVNLVIDNLEGGYYHPNMLKDGRVKDSRYSTSGETMFGIDRKQGGSINDTAAGKQFWGLIDAAGAKDKWAWNYKGGTLSDQLKPLVGQMMMPEYNALSSKYLSSDAKALVESDARLLFNFIYAAWNGSGWFQKFATKINQAVASGITNVDQLTDIAVQARTQSSNSLIAQGGGKIAQLVGQLKSGISDIGATASEFVADPVAAIKKNPVIFIGGLTMVITSLTILIWLIGKVGKGNNNSTTLKTT